jgi:hypothetical protein
LPKDGDEEEEQVKWNSRPVDVKGDEGVMKGALCCEGMGPKSRLANTVGKKKWLNGMDIGHSILA